MKISAAALASLAVSGASAFSPFARTSAAVKKAAAPTSTKDDPLNGWVPDAGKFAYGLPGSLEPTPDFDPLGFAKGADLQMMIQYRESEVQHGRVAMLAAIGMLITEEPFEIHPLFGGADHDIGPAIRHLDEVRAVAPGFFELLALVVGGFELNRAVTGWNNPLFVYDSGKTFQDGYYPGDVNWDPLGLKPEDPAEFADMQTRELQNGRLAMLGVAGMVISELLSGKEIFVNLGLATDRFDPSSLPAEFLPLGK